MPFVKSQTKNGGLEKLLFRCSSSLGEIRNILSKQKRGAVGVSNFEIGFFLAVENGRLDIVGLESDNHPEY